jgi:hypothetical protein
MTTDIEGDDIERRLRPSRPPAAAGSDQPGAAGAAGPQGQPELKRPARSTSRRPGESDEPIAATMDAADAAVVAFR